MKRLALFGFIIFLLPVITTAQPDQSFTGMDVFELEWVQDPQISPDGDKIVYVRRGMDKMKDRRFSRLWIMDADGSNHRKLSARDVNESSPRWSPDGNRIVFTSSSEDHGSEIYIYWIESGAMARITQLEESPRGLSWSPNGEQLAFNMKVPENNPKLTSSTQAPNGAEWADNPRVTKRLKYESDGSGYIDPGFTHIFTVPAQGGAPRQITDGDCHHRSSPVWSDDGDASFFQPTEMKTGSEIGGTPKYIQLM